MDASPLSWPRKTGESEVPGWDSARWNDFTFRDDDIVVASYPKSGTTLTQQIVAQLVFGGDRNIYGAAANLSPWLEFSLSHDAADIAAAQKHRRFLKTHLPVKNLVISPKAKYIVVARDVRDVVWSFHHHLINFINLDPGRTPMPDVRQYYHDFLDGSGQQFPYWPHIQSWWDVRHLPNLLTLHYADLIADLPAVVRRVAAFLTIPIDEALFPEILRHCGIEHMRKVAQDDPSLNKVFREGSKTFINQGTNGRWRDVLTIAEIEKADHIAARELTPDCATWLRGDQPLRSLAKLR
jgi:aryl sulfotransferase